MRGTLGLMDPANRLENWDQEEDEERFYMPVNEKVIPYDLLNSEESFYWACVCRSVQCVCVCVCVCVCTCVCNPED